MPGAKGRHCIGGRQTWSPSTAWHRSRPGSRKLVSYRAPLPVGEAALESGKDADRWRPDTRMGQGLAEQANEIEMPGAGHFSRQKRLRFRAPHNRVERDETGASKSWVPVADGQGARLTRTGFGAITRPGEGDL